MKTEGRGQTTEDRGQRGPGMTMAEVDDYYAGLLREIKGLKESLKRMKRAGDGEESG